MLVFGLALLAVGSGGAMATCASRMPIPRVFLAPAAGWHAMHFESSVCARPVCATRPAGSVAAKLTPSWQEPQARRLGLVAKLPACVAGNRWHLSQLRISCG